MYLFNMPISVKIRQAKKVSFIDQSIGVIGDRPGYWDNKSTAKEHEHIRESLDRDYM